MRARILLIFLGLLLTIPAIGNLGADTLQLSPALDISLGSLSLGSFIFGEVIQPAPPPQELLPRESLPFPDHLSINPYNGSLDLTSDITQYASFLLPGLLIFLSPEQDPLTLGILYTQSVFLSYGMKNIIKSLFPRPRPYCYYSPTGDEEDYRSFPSGHTTMAFTGAGFLISSLLILNPDSPWVLPLAGASVALAIGTAVLRVASGNHYITDVLAGAALGTLSGAIIPLLHRQREKN